MNFQMFQLVLEKTEESEIKFWNQNFDQRSKSEIKSNICWIIEKTRECHKNIYFCFIDYAKAFEWITINCEKFWKRWEYQTSWLASWEICMQVRKQQLELGMKQQAGSK